MESEQINSYYNLLKNLYLNQVRSWADKAKEMRSIYEQFYKELTHTRGNLADALNIYYKNSNKQIFDAAVFLKNKLNTIVHSINCDIDKEDYCKYYNMLVRLIYLASNVSPDEATMNYIGCIVKDELSGLNDEQKDIVLCDDQIVYASAGPGTGKTHLLVNKLLHYINKSSVRELIVALSFTNTAAFELGERFRKAAFESKLERSYSFYNGTIHSFCFNILKNYSSDIGEEFNYIIIDDSDIEDLAKEINTQNNYQYNIDDIKECLKSRLNTKTPKLQSIINEIKKHYCIISIDDILFLFLEYLKNKQFCDWLKTQITILVVDEAQDLTKQNFKIFEGLLNAIPKLKLFFVGDPRQNIFGFNGGSYENLSKFLSNYRYTKKKLTGTYRCPQNICNYVNTFSFDDCENNPLRNVHNKTGTIRVLPYPNLESEVYGVLNIIKNINNYQESSVICRSLYYLEPLLKILNSNKIPYKVLGGKKIVKEHIKFFNHLLRIIETDNEYSIRAVCKICKIQLKESSARIADTFYSESTFEILKTIKEDIKQKNERADIINLNIIGNALIDHFYGNNIDKNVKEDFEKLSDMLCRYNSISDYLLSFAIDRENYSGFLKKNYVECTVPVTDSYLTVSTIHSAKGLEWDNVIIMGLAEGTFPNTWFDRNRTEEEKKKSINDSKKLMFVAATRAKSNLYLTYSSRNKYGYKVDKSRFIINVN